ncbi:MAG: rhodanese-like domain-containing protein [Bacteroidia bacterium]
MADINVIELKAKLDNNEDFLLIDVREEWEYEDFNIGAKNIPLGNIQGTIDDLDDWMEKEVVVHCKSGMRSAAARDFMIREGFKNVRNLEGGIMAWQTEFA